MAQVPQGRDGPPTGKRDTEGMRDTRDTRDIVRLVVFGIALVLLIAFVIANSATVRVHFVFFQTRTSLIWVILISAVLGVLVDRLVIALGKRRKTRKQP
jgi:uncharacterized integral membrane protein